MDFFVFYIGCCLGSFCHLVSYRLIKNEDWIFKRSYSECCNKELHLIYVLPIFSYLFLKGKCPFCHQKISIRHLFLELVSGLGIYLLYLYSNYFFIETLIIMILFIISLMDLQLMEFNGELLFILAFLMFVYKITTSNHTSLFLLFICLFLKNKLGDGDFWIIILMSFCLDYRQWLLFIYISVFLGTIYSLYFIITKKQSLKNCIPFCPFLSIGVFFAFMFG